MSNIVQVEFFHVGGDSAQTLDDVMEDCASRTSDGAPIKTCVRFYDVTGKITQQVLQHEEVDKRCGELEERIPQTTGFKQDFLCWLHRRTLKKLIRKREALLPYTIHWTEKATKTPEHFAIEQNDHSYRHVHCDELHEELERIGQAKNVWVFVFEPNDLLADENELITYAM